MSNIKNILQDWQDNKDWVDQALYEAQTAMASMAEICWLNDDCRPFDAPDSQWLALTRAQLADMTAWLEEMQSARDCIDGKSV